MALKDWKKLANGGYKLKDGVGEVFVAEENVRRYDKLGKTAFQKVYTFYHHYLGDGGHPDPKIFSSKAKAHAHLMKHVKTKDY